MITKKKPAKLAEEILLELYPFRRQLNNNACQHDDALGCFTIHLAKLIQQIATDCFCIARFSSEILKH